MNGDLVYIIFRIGHHTSVKSLVHYQVCCGVKRVIEVHHTTVVQPNVLTELYYSAFLFSHNSTRSRLQQI